MCKKSIIIFKKISVIFLFACSLIVVGCGNKNTGKKWFRDRSNDYTCIEQNESVRIPAGLSSEPLSDEYNIPGT